MKRLSTRWRDPTRRTSAAAPPKHSPTAHHRPLPAEQVSDPQARAILITASGGGLPGVQAKDYKDVLEDLTGRDIKGLTSLTRPGVPDQDINAALALLAAAAGKKDSAQGEYKKDNKASDAYKRVQGSIDGLGQFAFVKMITDAGWNPSAVAPDRNVKDQGCAIQLLTNHRICVLEGLNADRDDSSFIEVSTPLEKLVRARLESGRALAIPSAPFPLPAAPALGHAAHPNPHRRPPQARTKLTSCTTQDATVIAPRIFTKVTIYDIDDYRKVWTDTEDNGFNPTGHKTSREIFKLSRIVDYEYVQPMVDMSGAYCPETKIDNNGYLHVVWICQLCFNWNSNRGDRNISPREIKIIN